MSRFDSDLWMGSGLHYPTSTVECFGDVDSDLASRVVKALHVLDRKAQPITLLLMTDGGCESAGMAIFDAIKRCSNAVTVLGTGIVASMGVLILQAGDRRVLSPNCDLMVHEGSLEVPSDHRRNVRAYTAHTTKKDRTLDGILLDRIREAHPTFTQRRLDDSQRFDWWLTAAEAVDLGLADEVLDV